MHNIQCPIVPLTIMLENHNMEKKPNKRASEIYENVGFTLYNVYK